MSSESPSNNTAPPTPVDTGTSPSPKATTGDASPQASPTAWRSPLAHIRFWLIVVGGLILDLWSKHWAFQELGQTGRRILIDNVLEFHTTLNPGALFGIGEGHTEVFLIASALALVLVLWMFAHSPRRRWFTHIALGAILAGALGNMYDRVFVRLHLRQTQSGPVAPYWTKEFSEDRKTAILREYPPDRPGARVRRVPAAEVDQLTPEIGYVRDFIKIPTQWFGEKQLWPWVFNVADMLLVGGVAYLALRMLRERRPHPAGEGERSQLDQEPEKT